LEFAKGKALSRAYIPQDGHALSNSFVRKYTFSCGADYASSPPPKRAINKSSSDRIGIPGSRAFCVLGLAEREGYASPSSPKRTINSSSDRIGIPSSRAFWFLEEADWGSLFTRKLVFFDTLPATLPPFFST